MSEPEIDELRDRWESDRSPALTLELVDAYRRRGDHGGALEVLSAGLEANPDHVATRVAKGRCHLDLEQVEEAIRELAPVVIDDPAHLVANQLLADAHARQGDVDRARDRLELFELLGGSAEQVEAIERQLDPAAADRAVAADQVAAAEPEGVEPPADDATAAEVPAPTVAEESGAGAPDEDDADPFVLLDWIEFDESRYAAALSTEGIFAPASGAPVAAEGGATPTLTLGELYRKQGHREEAVGIFREILARQPGNVEAARALGELEKDGGWPLSAEDLLGGGAESGNEGGAEVLRRYRDRLRGRE